MCIGSATYYTRCLGLLVASAVLIKTGWKSVDVPRRIETRNTTASMQSTPAAVKLDALSASMQILGVTVSLATLSPSPFKYASAAMI